MCFVCQFPYIIIQVILNVNTQFDNSPNLFRFWYNGAMDEYTDPTKQELENELRHYIMQRATAIPIDPHILRDNFHRHYNELKTITKDILDYRYTPASTVFYPEEYEGQRYACQFARRADGKIFLFVTEYWGGGELFVWEYRRNS